MIEVRFHGRGGQGVVTAASVLAMAAFHDGKEAQAFPFFGVERTGAPLEAYCRIDDSRIKLHQQVYEPDYVVVLDDTLLSQVDVHKGLKKEGKVVIASNKPVEGAFVVDALEIAKRELGRPLVNIPVLGAFAKATGLVTIESLEKAIKQQFAHKAGVAEKNIKALRACYEKVKI